MNTKFVKNKRPKRSHTIKQPNGQSSLLMVDEKGNRIGVKNSKEHLEYLKKQRSVGLLGTSK